MQRFIDEHSFFEAVFDDLDDITLNQHYNIAITDEDYEYAQECLAEAEKRNVRLIYEEA